MKLINLEFGDTKKMSNSFVALIPARGGSKGIPRKNLKTVSGLPLISHTINFAIKSEFIKNVFVSTDDLDIAKVAKECGANIPFIRPAELSEDSSPMIDVIRHFWIMCIGDSYLLLLDPTSPIRRFRHLEEILSIMNKDRSIDGVISVSEPYFNPLWVGVNLDQDKVLTRMNLVNGEFTSRQKVPRYLRINGSYYCWRPEVASALGADYLKLGRYVGYETPEKNSMSIDSIDELEQLESLLKTGTVKLIDD